MTKVLQTVRVLQGHEKAVRAVVFSPDGKLLATGSMDKSIKLWAVESSQLVRTINGHRYSVRSLAFSPNGETLVAGAGEWFDRGDVKAWEASTGKLQQVVADDCSVVCASLSARHPIGR